MSGPRLTETERKIVEYLLLGSGRAVATTEILHAVWGGLATHSAVTTNVARLAPKLAALGVTVHHKRGHGYWLEGEINVSDTRRECWRVGCQHVTTRRYCSLRCERIDGYRRLKVA